MSERKRVTTWIDKRLWAETKKRATLEEKSAADIVNEALKEKVDTD